MSGSKDSIKSPGGKNVQRLKILEDLERQKRQYKTPVVGNSTFQSTPKNSRSNTTASSYSIIAGPSQCILNDQQDLKQRDFETKVFYGADFSNITSKGNGQSNLQGRLNGKQAFDKAVKTSFGYYIYEDSAFGNSILPVIPRFPPTEVSSEPPVIDLD